MKSIIFVFLGALILFSCTNSNKEAYINQVDSLLLVNDSTQKLLEAFDFHSLEETYHRVKGYTKILQEYMVDMPSDTAHRSKLTLHGNLDKGFKRAVKAIRPVENDLNFSKTQLTNLLDDIKNDRVNADSIQIYINDERVVLEELKNKLRYQDAERKEMEASYSKIEDYIKQVTDSLLKANVKE